MDAPNPQSTYELKLDLGPQSGLTDTAKRNRDALIQAYKDQLAGDWGGWWRIFDKDVVFREAASLPYGCTIKGLEETKAGLAGMFGAWTHLNVVIEEFAAAGDLVIAYIQMTATSTIAGQRRIVMVARSFFTVNMATSNQKIPRSAPAVTI